MPTMSRMTVWRRMSSTRLLDWAVELAIKADVSISSEVDRLIETTLKQFDRAGVQKQARSSDP